MKGELEELGEETDGIESISKIQTQILNLTKNKVNIFDSNDDFKSTYEILKEISEVWDNLNSKNRANLQEILFGKTRANQGLAVINAFQSGQIEKALNASKNSIGSAQAEFDEFSKGIQSHISDFRQAYNILSSEIINGETVKFVIDSGTSILNLLSKIIDDIGILGVAISGLSAFKGKDIFSGLSNAFKSEQSILETIRGLSELSKFNIDLSVVPQNEISALQNYIDLIKQSGVANVDLSKTLEGTSAATRLQAQNFQKMVLAEQNGTVSTKALQSATANLSTTQKVATATSKALSIGLNLLGNIGIMALVSGLTWGINKLIHAQEESRQKAEEMRKTAIETANSTEKEIESISSLEESYSKIVVSSQELKTAKEDLSNIQSQLIDKYGKEAESIDLLNGKYSDNIEKIEELKKAEAEEWLANNQAAIFEARKGSYDNSESLDVSRTARNIIKESGDYDSSFGKIKATGSVSDQIKTYEAARDRINDSRYSGWKDDYKVIVDQLAKLKEIKDEQQNILDLEKEYVRISREYIPDSMESNLDEKIAEAKNLYQELSVASTEGDRYFALDKLKDLKEEMLDMSQGSVQAQTIVENLFNSFEINGENAIESIGSLRDEWFKTLEDIQKGTLTNVSTIETAMQNLAEGKYLSSTDFWNIAKLDTKGVISDIRMVGKEFSLSQEQLIQLKDNMINEQLSQLKAEQEAYTNSIKQYRETMDKLSYNSLGEKSLESKSVELRLQAAQNIKEYETSIKRNNVLIKELNSNLGNTVDITKQLEAEQKKIEDRQKDLQDRQKQLNNDIQQAQKVADNYAAAMNKKIDDTIGSLNKEKEELESEKNVLDEQLSALEEKEEVIKNTISDYKELVNTVKTQTDKEIDLLKEQKQAEEEAIQAKIDALKEAKEEQSEANELAEKQLDIQKKLADLEKAKQNKVKIYSSELGYHYEGDREAIANAESAVAESQKAYDSYIDEKLYNEQLEALENQKNVVSENFDSQIESYEKFYEQWKEIIDEQTNSENEQIANQILGVEWREKIKNKDTNILNTFKSNFKSYNNQLNSLVNNEMATLKASIQAKEGEIKAKEAQIQTWNNYKNEVSEAIDSIKGKYDEYLQYLDDFNLSELASYEDRENALNGFKETYEGMIDEVNDKTLSLSAVEAELDGLSERLQYLQDLGTIPVNIETNLSEVNEEMREFIREFADGIELMASHLANSETGYGIVNSQWDYELAKASRIKAKYGYSQGGVIGYTGIANVHGTQSKAETVFNASQGKALYDMVRTNSFSSMVADKAVQGLSSGLNLSRTVGNTDNSSRTINIQQVTIKADNPVQFKTQMENYLNTKYNEIRIS